jgi:hypothetical protein
MVESVCCCMLRTLRRRKKVRQAQAPVKFIDIARKRQSAQLTRSPAAAASELTCSAHCASMAFAAFDTHPGPACWR